MGVISTMQLLERFFDWLEREREWRRGSWNHCQTSSGRWVRCHHEKH